MVPPRFAILPHALDVQAVMDAALLAGGAGAAGACTLFVGAVRRQNMGRDVRYLEYEAYGPLALRALERIDDEIRASWPGVALAIHHRTGAVPLGDASVVIAAASPHRAEAFAASRYAIERIKQIVPIWKREHFEGGDVWIEGATADPDNDAARQEALSRAVGA
jgi:molybdopterin synthase catalytic subunit